MQSPRRQNVEVVVSVNGHSPTTGGRVQPLSVQEALQFSPFTTSTITGHERIPVPQIGQATHFSNLTTSAERKSIRRSLDEIVRSSTPQSSGQTSLQDVRHSVDMLLDGEALPEFKFKTAHFSHQPTMAGYPSTVFVPELSPLASMVLDSSDVAYKYLTPKTPSPKISRTTFLPTPALSASPERTESVQRLDDYKESPRKPKASSVTAGKKTSGVVIKPLPPGSQHEEYQRGPDSPKRRKLNDDEQSARIALHVRAQKEEADVQLAKFQDLLFEIFEAQDQMVPDTSTSSNHEESQFFEYVADAEDSSMVLTTKIHSKIQNAIKKLIDYQRFTDVPADHIKRLQNLCESSLSVTQTLNLGLGSASDESELEQWHGRLRTAENGATSACTVGWTILGSLHDKSLFSEDVVQYLPNVLTNIFENCLIPVVEARSSGQTSELFQAASSSKDALMRLLGQGKKLLDLVARLSVQMDGAENAMNKTEFLATQLVFVENSPHERESVLGAQVFEQVRRTAMEALAKIFAKYPDQRPPILDEIVNSLEKLPSTTRAARQYKLTDGKNIQLFSALVVQLVQTATSEPSHHSTPRGAKSLTNDLFGGSQPEDNDEDAAQRTVETGMPEQPTEEKSLHFLLNEKAEALQSNARASAHHVIKFLVGKAMRTTKTGDQPYRNLIDLFTEDLISILASPDWPASELLLWMLARHMIEILKKDETGTAKNMAIELLGKMGSAISNLRLSVPHLAAAAAAAVNGHDSTISRNLQQFADDQLRAGVGAEDIVTAQGPYRITLDFLHDRAISEWQLISAERFYLLQWAKVLCLTFGFDQLDHSTVETNADTTELTELVYNMLTNPSSVEVKPDSERISPPQARLAYTLTVLNQNFCKLFDGMVNLLLFSISSDQAKIRSKSLKSVINLLEVDPSLLDRDQNIMRTIFRCASDQSPMVRDSALSLIAKCMSLKPSLEEDACKVILGCATDSTTGVRKRAIGLMKDIYIRDSRPDLQAAISRSLMERTFDNEESVAGLARQTLRELWVASLLHIVSTSNDSAKADVAILEQTFIIVLAVSHNAERLVLPLESFFRSVMRSDSKDSGAVRELCKRIVANLFERVVNGSEGQVLAAQERSTREGLLLTLVALAKAEPKLVVPEQLKALQPYVNNLAGSDDLLLFRSVVNVYRCVLPCLSSSQQTLLAEIQNALFKTISKLPRTELNEVMACLWTIDGVLKNTERLARLTISVLSNIQRAKTQLLERADGIDSTEQSRSANQLRSYIRIAGSAGKCWDLQRDLASFKKAFPTWTGDSVAALIVDSICPLTSPSQPGNLRAMALESLGAVCQSWPGQFSRDNVREALSGVFQEHSNDLQMIVLKTFAEFFGVREGVSETPMDVHKEEEEDHDLGRLSGSLKASDHDGAAALIAQHYLDPIIRVAMTRQDNNALTAIKVIASINRQGLKHPKETAGVLVALETSTEPDISDIAYESHRLMHQQHETLFEKEYMRAVQEAFLYQKTVVKDLMGATTRPFQSKLWRLFDVIRMSNARYVKKFISNLVSRTDFERNAIDLSNDPPDHVLFVRFIVHNLAYFEYGRLDELFHAILQLENLVGKTGTDLAQAMETIMEPTQQTPETGLQPETSEHFRPALVSAGKGDTSTPVEPATLRRLVAAAMVLSMLWEARTHLKRQYGITHDVRQLMGKGADAKELSKTPTKVHGVNGDRFWDNVASIMLSLKSHDAMMTRCHEFTNLMNVDEDVKVAAEDDEAREAFSVSVGPEGEISTPTMGGKGSRPGKRKSTASVGGTPKKKRGRPSINGRRKSSSNLDEEDDGWE